MNLSTKRKLSRWMLAAGIAALSWSTWHYDVPRYADDIYTEAFGNKLERTMKGVAGHDARTCGMVYVPHDAPLVNPCSDTQDREQGAFYTVYAVPSKDGVLFRGIARVSDGSYKEYHWKPAPEQVQYVFAGPDPEPVPCIDPHALRKTWQNVPTCTADR
jgi:hypothetical protein